ncbi:MAG: PadR family transcriptional regulator [Conexivisphaerales archaeon]
MKDEYLYTGHEPKVARAGLKVNAPNGNYKKLKSFRNGSQLMWRNVCPKKPPKTLEMFKNDIGNDTDMWNTNLYKSFLLKKQISKHGGLRFMVLYILKDGPKNGAEIMDEVEKISHGWWRPSPGSIYPLLSVLVSEGLIDKLNDRKYKLTVNGETKVKEFTILMHKNEMTIEEMLDAIDNYVLYFEDLGSNKLAPYKERIEQISKKLEALLK